jgi:hypothetical protein
MPRPPIRIGNNRGTLTEGLAGLTPAFALPGHAGGEAAKPLQTQSLGK